MPNGNGSSPVPPAVLDRSVETMPPPEQAPTAVSDSGWGIMAFAGAAIADFPDWGTLVQRRDVMLREFLPREPIAAGAFGSVISRYASFSWTLKGQGRPRLTAACQDMLLSANLGKGWAHFISTLAVDYLTADKGAFVELIRTADSADSPVIGIRSLNSLQCWSTGNPEFPVVFWDRLSGKYRVLRWYQVHHLVEMPMASPLLGIARVYDLQLCALSRALLAVKAFLASEEYLEEKVSGRHHKAIHVITGIGKNELADAMKLQENAANEKWLRRYIQPVVVAALSPQADPKVATLELSTLPEGWQAEPMLRQYLICLSLGLLTDYQELAPLPGGNLGTGAQSEILDKKAKNKGAGLFRKNLTHLLNRIILPDGIEFAFDEQDLDEDKAAADAREARAKGRALMKATGEVDAMGARQIALDDGDISPELFEAMQQRDLTEQKIRDDEREKILNEQLLASGNLPEAPPDSGPPAATTVSPSGGIIKDVTAAAPAAPAIAGPAAGAVVTDENKPKAGAPGVKETREAFEDQIGPAEQEAAGLVEGALARVYRSLSKRLAALE